MDFIKKLLNWIASIPQDKLLHNYGAELIAMFSFAILFRFCPLWLCFVLSNMLGVIALVIKERYDAKHQGSVEIADVLWGIIGILIWDAAALIMFIK